MEFIGGGQWDHEDRLVWELDFRRSADREAWGWAPVADGETDDFSESLAAMAEGLKWLYAVRGEGSGRVGET